MSAWHWSWPDFWLVLGGVAIGFSLRSVMMERSIRSRLRSIYDAGYALGREHGFELRKFHRKDIEATFQEAYDNARRTLRGAR